MSGGERFADGTFHGCVNNATGVVRMIDELARAELGPSDSGPSPATFGTRRDTYPREARALAKRWIASLGNDFAGP